MNHSTQLTFAALTALTLAAVPTRATAGPDSTTLPPASPGFTQAVSWRAPEPHGPWIPPPPDSSYALAMNEAHHPRPVEFSGMHYEPHSGRSNHHSSGLGGVSQLHMGYFDPDDKQGPRFDMGVRAGSMLDRNLQIGIAADWITKSEHISNVSSTTNGPGGVPIVVQQDIAQASLHMFPVMGYLQFQANNTRAIAPYAGVGGGYEVLVLSGDDFVSGQRFEGTFTGWGWQAWGGAGLPLGEHTRLNGEVFVNAATLGRDALDPITGVQVRETVNGNGGGMRVGLAWGF